MVVTFLESCYSNMEKEGQDQKSPPYLCFQEHFIADGGHKHWIFG